MRIPAVEVRLTSSEAQLIAPGLRQMASALESWQSAGQLPLHALELQSFARHRGRYEPTFAAMIQQLNLRFSPARLRRSRLQLNAWELAISALAVRLTLRNLRHGHIQLRHRRPTSSGKRLLKKIELHRKRAKKMFVRAFSLSDFLSASRMWKQMLLFLKTRFVQCNCAGRNWAPGMRKHYVQMVDSYCALALEGLRLRSIQPPPELRLWMRAMLANIRRGEADIGVGTLLMYRSYGRTFLADYVENRMSDQTHKEGRK